MNVIGIDLGLSALKIVLVNEVGTLIAQERIPLTLQSPHPGWAEQNPSAWWKAVQDGFLALKQNHSNALRKARAMSITAGAHIAVLCNAKAEPLRPAILWNDQRASAQAKRLTELGIDTEIAGNCANPTWTLPQLIWLHEHEPELKFDRIYFAKDWLRAQFTGDHMTDPSDACGAMLCDYRTEEWSQALCAEAHITPQQLPKIVPHHELAGTINPKVAADLGLPPELVIAIGAIDTSAEWLCCGPLKQGAMSLKLASAGVVSITTQAAAPAPPISRYPHLDPAYNYFAAGMNQCASAIDWAANLFFSDSTIDSFFDAAIKSPIGANGVQFHPYLNGERAPLWQSDLTASFSQMTRATNRNDIARAVLEGVGFAFRDIWLSLPSTLINEQTMQEHIALIGGGTRSAIWCQIIANILGKHCYVPQYYDAAYGAALIASAASQQDILRQSMLGAIKIEPEKSANQDYLAHYENFIKARKQLYSCDN